MCLKIYEMDVENIQFVLVIFLDVYYNEKTKLKGGTLEWHM